MTKFITKKFIEVTALKFQYTGNEVSDNSIVKEKVCINADCITYFEESGDNGCIIHLTDTRNIHCSESYKEIKKRLNS